jgi:protein-disulfide isomerase
MERRTLLAAGGAALLGGAGFLALRPGPHGETSNMFVSMANAQEAGATAAIPDMVLGDPEAPIEVIEYASYTCPHCANFHTGMFKDIKENYIDTGKVKFVYREVYFDLPGLWASMVARCGGNDQRFFGITNIIYDKQREWISSGDPAVISQELMRIGLTAGLTQETLDVCMSDADQAQSLMAWYQENAERDNVTGTPSFVINGEKYSANSVRTFADFAAVLDDLLAG